MLRPESRPAGIVAWTLSIILVALTTVLTAHPALAASMTYNVTSTPCTGAGSITAAMDAANANPGEDTISFDADLPLACPFGLTIGEAGSASLTVRTPLLRERSLNRSGDGFTDASGDAVSARREAETWMVTVGNEYYEIPAGVLRGE